jgi:isoleucyl-tRNA synthetase
MGLLYRDFRVTAYCPRCGTALSDHEVAMGYTTVEDPSVYVKFPIVEAPDPDLVGASLVGWTTTPWTLISNLGLAVAAEERYELRSREGDRVVVAGARAEEVLGEGWALERAFPGSHLVAPGPVRYRPPYENADDDTHRVVAAGFVSMVEGTGIVHMAPAFGAEDLEVARAEGWPLYNPVDGEGRFTDLAPTFVRGQFVKDADPGIVEDLGRRGLLVSAGTLHHTYPLCWRCETPLLYYARPAWYVRTTARKDQLLEANDGVSWFPAHIKDGRYGDWLHNNVDWSLSRERFWGTPLPVWQCGEEHVTVVGSLAELSELAGRDVTGVDPHRPAIDDVVVACPECGAEARRVPEVIDAWFDSGAMPYAQWGYMGPGSDGEENFRRRFPADFIAEGIDQTRGWFYSLMAEGVLLFDTTAYRNVICHGLVLDAEGRKMSKRLGNVIEPEDAFDRFGADAVRWFMVASGSPWADRRASFEVIGDVVRRVLLTLWNTFSFAVLYGNIDQPDLAGAPPPPDRPSTGGSCRGCTGRWRESGRRWTATTPPARLDGSAHSSTTCRTGTCGDRAGGSGTRLVERPPTPAPSSPRTPRCTSAWSRWPGSWRRSRRSWPRRSTARWWRRSTPMRRHPSISPTSRHPTRGWWTRPSTMPWTWPEPSCRSAGPSGPTPGFASANPWAAQSWGCRATRRASSPCSP